MLRFLSWFFTLIFSAIILGCIAAAGIFYYYGAGLPDFKHLASYEPPVVTRLYSNDGCLFAEYAYEKRIYVPITEIPDLVKQAFLSAEDKNFYHHFGIDVPSVINAALKNLSQLGSSKRPLGASTITQQVAKNFLLADISHAVSIERKIKEAILSLRIEKAYPKDYIFELYLNEVYLGSGAHGVAAAALNYFNKSLAELSLSEAAFLATLPKAPSRYHPERSKELTMARRNWVLDRMLEDRVITKEQYEVAKAEPIVLHKRDPSKVVQASYFAEEVRRDLVRILGEKALYQNGYVVRTTLDPELQKIAEDSLKKGLIDYDRKHGWRGAVAKLDLSKEVRENKGDQQGWPEKLKTVMKPPGSGAWELAVVLEVYADRVLIGLTNEQTGIIPLSELKWARLWVSDEARGPEVTHPKQILSVGDVVLVSAVNPSNDDKSKEKEKDKPNNKTKSYQLNQIPAVSGAIVALEPHTGRVLAMQGGYSFEISQFNRATQAMRQTGSAFKTFVFLSAFEAGLTPSTVIYDSPFSISMGWGLGIWAPHNWDNKFFGPMTLRQTFEQSRNVATVRMVHERVGMKGVIKVAKRFNVNPNMPLQLSGVLGSCETTVLRLTAANAMIANGGKLVTPSFFDHVQDRRGKAVLVNTYTICEGCGPLSSPDHVPVLKDLRPQVADPVVTYQMTSLLSGVVERGTGKLLKVLNQPIAVKSGTTNEFRDAWMVGYSPTIVVGVYVGFDTPRTLGIKHFGAVVAGPIFLEFMKRALANKSPRPFKVPEGVKLVRVNAKSGQRTSPEDPNAIWEAFRAGDEVIGDAPGEVGAGIHRAARSSDSEEENQFEDDEIVHEQWQPIVQQKDSNVSGTGSLY